MPLSRFITAITALLLISAAIQPGQTSTAAAAHETGTIAQASL